jgi:hypothetical protein
MSSYIYNKIIMDFYIYEFDLFNTKKNALFYQLKIFCNEN